MSKIYYSRAVKLKSVLSKRIHELEEDEPKPDWYSY